MLEGEVEFTAGDETVVLGPGTLHRSRPPGATHGLPERTAAARGVLNLHAPGAGFIDEIRAHLRRTS